jgi:hypothetical protein
LAFSPWCVLSGKAVAGNQAWQSPAGERWRGLEGRNFAVPPECARPRAQQAPTRPARWKTPSPHCVRTLLRPRTGALRPKEGLVLVARKSCARLRIRLQILLAESHTSRQCQRPLKTSPRTCQFHGNGNISCGSPVASTMGPGETVLCVVPVVLFLGGIGAAIGSQKERRGEGFLLGLHLGPIGWVIADLLDYPRKCPECEGGAPKNAKRCPHCGSLLVGPSAPPAREL